MDTLCLRDPLRHNINLDPCTFLVQPQEDDATMRPSFTKDPIPKVLVVGDQNPPLGKGLGQEGVITHTAGLFVRGVDIMPLFTQPARQRRPCAFIDQEPHSGSFPPCWLLCTSVLI